MFLKKKCVCEIVHANKNRILFIQQTGKKPQRFNKNVHIILNCTFRCYAN